ncbi:response regulator [Pseudoalteromonas sp. MTN2-4]|uniref:response regulator n=1 Tax=Pseudoalteromonas sp. MTN2-4 TaxID=3056555 RepID=UPI0036F2CCFD
MQLSTVTLLLMSGVGVFTSAVSLIFLWLANRDIIAVRYWAISSCFLMTGLLLFNSQSVLPETLKYVLPNFVVQTSFLFILQGTYRACEQNVPKVELATFITCYVVLHLFLTFIYPSYPLRFTLGVTTVLIFLSWVLWCSYRYSQGRFKVSSFLILLSVVILFAVSFNKIIDMNWQGVTNLQQDDSIKAQWFIIALFMSQLLFNFAFAIMTGEIRNNKNKSVQKQLITANEALKIEKARAEKHSKLKSEFLANMSHEIRTPINGVIGCLELLQNTTLSKQQDQYTELAYASANSLLGVINDILDFSKIESGKLEINNEPVELLALLDSVAKSFAIALSNKSVMLFVDCHQVTHHNLLLDPVRVRQILNNLLSNAIKFTHQGHVKLILSSQLQHDGRVLINGKVIDTGIGIDSQAQLKLFNAFSQCDASTTRLYGGTGLGLVIVKRLCNLMGGDVELRNSSPDKGTEFAFSIQAGLDESIIAEEQSLNVANLIGLFSPNTTFSSILLSQFESRGLKLDILDSKFISQSRYDLIILDLVNCSDTGLESTYLLESAQRQAQQVSIICDVNSKLPNSQLVKGSGCAVFYHPFTCYDLMQLFTKKVEQIPTTTLVVENEGRAKRLAGLKILLAEDNKVNQVVATKMLSNWQIEFEIANSGQEALTILENSESGNFDLILMDCQMPIIDGYQATKEIRENPKYNKFKSIPIIALTANAMNGDKEKCLQAGMSGYVSKPIEVGKLNAEIMRLIAPFHKESSGHS